MLHPGGTIGARLTPVEDVMHGGDRLPLVPLDLPMRDVLVVMTEKSLGIAGVIDHQGRLAGVITDGDLRRHIDELGVASAQQVMTGNPRTVPVGTVTGDARALLGAARITALFVVARDDPRRPVGVLHIHDLARCDLAEDAAAVPPVHPAWDQT
jgi:arabinose-5-phosphate isomerase